MRASFWLLTVGSLFLSTVSSAADRYQTVLNRMEELHQKYPTTTQIFSIGTNDDGVAIQAMRISTHPSEVDLKKIGHILVSTHHGNELAAPQFTLHFMEDLLKRFNGQEYYAGSLADQEWTIIPVLNISGYNAGRREEHGQDPNRDYPGPCINATGGKIKSIKTLMNFLGSRPFVGSLTVHGYAAALTYPWGVSTTNTHSEDHNLFEKITAKAASLNGYRYGTSTDIVYPCDGAYEDYTYWKYGMWSLLLELRNGDAEDIRSTSQAIAMYYDQLDSSPSTHHELIGKCDRARKPDLRNE